MEKCQSLRNVTSKKLEMIIQDMIMSCNVCSKTFVKYSGGGGYCKKCGILCTAFSRYFDANIPVKYWTLNMQNDFFGDETLLKKYNDLTSGDNIRKSFLNGESFCLAGGFGVGKTMMCVNILKIAVEKGYSALYVNLNDIISACVSDEKFLARKELLEVDFLVIDEFDPRYIGSELASDFFGRVLEDVLRIRLHNNSPLFMCTNSDDVISDSFSGIIEQSFKSLMSQIPTILVLGNDFRQKMKK